MNIGIAYTYSIQTYEYRDRHIHRAFRHMHYAYSIYSLGISIQTQHLGIHITQLYMHIAYPRCMHVLFQLSPFIMCINFALHHLSHDTDGKIQAYEHIQATTTWWESQGLKQLMKGLIIGKHMHVFMHDYKCIALTRDHNSRLQIEGCVIALWHYARCEMLQR